MQRLVVAIAAFACVLAAAPTALAGGPAMTLGVADDDLRAPTLVQIKARMTIVRLVGFRALRIHHPWYPGQAQSPEEEMTLLRNIAWAAGLNGISIYLVHSHPGSRTTPLTPEARAEFTSDAAGVARAVPQIRRFIIGNEPNLNRFWLPQFNPDGSDAAAPAYLQLLAETYDALKAVSPRIKVIGGALSPRGEDKANSIRQTHSPTVFIRDMGIAYRASGRTKPVMDEFAIHPYQQRSDQPATTRHPNSTTISIADYPKLVRLLGEAFDGTAQRGSTLPIDYMEYGVESRIPGHKIKAYTGTEPTTTHPVPESFQAAQYRQSLGIAFCQPTVRSYFVFHLFDEPDLGRWQSGLYYVDKTPKATVGPVRTALSHARRGIIAKCPGMQLRVHMRVSFPSSSVLARTTRRSFRLRCDIDCSYVAQIERLPGRKAVVVKRGRLAGNTPARVLMPAAKLAPGRYWLSVRALAAVNPGTPNSRASAPFFIRKSSSAKTSLR